MFGQGDIRNDDRVQSCWGLLPGFIDIPMWSVLVFTMARSLVVPRLRFRDLCNGPLVRRGCGLASWQGREPMLMVSLTGVVTKMPSGNSVDAAHDDKENLSEHTLASGSEQLSRRCPQTYNEFGVTGCTTLDSLLVMLLLFFICCSNRSPATMSGRRSEAWSGAESCTGKIARHIVFNL
jgi:hypothetical protein